MGIFLSTEKERLSEFKQISADFSQKAKEDGQYKRGCYSFCLPRNNADENLYAGIREATIRFFADHEIKWHDGQDGFPSNHLCDSQVCCANFLAPFASQPEALAKLLRPVYPNLQRMLPVEDGWFVSFEWIGAENYLKELIHRNGKRSRGANFTSADAIVLFERTDGLRQSALIEWKYTESYSSSSLVFAKSGRDRTTIYQHLYDAHDCPLEKKVIPQFADLFYEPFYQFMRQQFLAHAMEKAHELEAEEIGVLHIAPRQNRDFMRITSPNLVHAETTATNAWKKMLKEPARFISVFTEDLFCKYEDINNKGLQDWWSYISVRYPWVLTKDNK